MKLFLVITALLISVVLLGAASNSTVTYVDHEKVAKGGTLATAPDLSVSVNRRTGPGQVEVHEKETDMAGKYDAIGAIENTSQVFQPDDRF